MGESQYAKYITTDIKIPSHPHTKVVPSPAIKLVSDENFGNGNFRLASFAITEPFEMVSQTHAHDFDQYLIFVGGDTTNMLDLGGEIEFWLGEEGNELEKFIFTKPFMVHVPKGLLHCPLRFTKVNDPSKPILHQDLVFTTDYKRKPAPNQE